jgi:two-component system, OmpR family, response regulator
MRLLLVEDDIELGRRLSDRLRGAGYAVDLATTRAEAELWPDLHHMAAIILDLGLPDGDGMQVLSLWRAQRVETPILILTARGSWQDKVEGLNAGADDFVVKPVRFEELLARLNALFRRHGGRADNTISAGGITLDAAARTAMLNGAALTLSKQEFRLLALFMDHAGQIMPQADLIEHLYALDDNRDHNAVEVLVGRLRRKIGRERVATVRGLGYRFVK